MTSFNSVFRRVMNAVIKVEKVGGDDGWRIRSFFVGELGSFPFERLWRVRRCGGGRLCGYWFG